MNRIVFLGAALAFPTGFAALPAPAKAPRGGGKVVVGANVHVSKATHTLQHRECAVAADPANAGRLFAAAMYAPAGLPREGPESLVERVVGYYSEDGGKTWRLSFKRDDGVICEPAAAFAPDGSLYFSCLHQTLKEWKASFKKPVKGGDPVYGRVQLTRSADGGNTWKPGATIRGFLDHPWLAVDCTGGKNRGRLYCFSANAKFPVLHVSADRGKTFAAPLACKPATYHVGAPYVGNPAVLSDGTLVLVSGKQQHRVDDPRVRPRIETFVSANGGRTVAEAAPVTREWNMAGGVPAQFPQLAADTTRGKYRDSLYVVWSDAGRRGAEGRVLLSTSRDKGRSWSGPELLSEQPAARGGDYAAYIPSVAVNKDGVVAVSWYDRRGLSPRVRGEGYPPGWNVRLRVSLDGGETWLPSVRVNEKPGKGPYNQVRDTAGLAADAAGNFHPVWVDDRTGKRQVWTATVQVTRE